MSMGTKLLKMSYSQRIILYIDFFGLSFRSDNDVYCVIKLYICLICDLIIFIDQMSKNVCMMLPIYTGTNI